MTINTWKDLRAFYRITGPEIADMALARAVAVDLGIDLIPNGSDRQAWRTIQAGINKTAKYQIDVDGVPGPQTRGGILRAMAQIGSIPPFDPYGLARTFLGTRDIPGSRHNPWIVAWHRRIQSWISNDETAWCSAFCNAMAEDCGYERSGDLAARSWLRVGQEVTLSEARPGDIVVLWRVKRSGWQGHVAFFEHYNTTRQIIYMLGGNQSDEVNVAGYTRDRLLGIRRIRPLARAEGSSKRIL